MNARQILGNKMYCNLICQFQMKAGSFYKLTIPQKKNIPKMIIGNYPKSNGYQVSLNQDIKLVSSDRKINCV